MLLRDMQDENAFDPRVIELPENIIDEILKHSWNAQGPIIVVVGLIVKFVKWWHSEKQYAEIVGSAETENQSMFSSDEQWQNEYWPRVNSEFEKVNCLMLEQL